VSDCRLVARCRTGDPAAWSELVERYSRYVFAIATQAFRLSPEDAEDVFQEVFVRAWQHLGRLRDDGAIRPWIGQVTRRTCIDRLRTTRNEVLDGEGPELVDPAPTLEVLAEALLVREALATLPEHCREILDRFYARDESYAAIGAALGLPAGTVASRLARCLSKLREELALADADTLEAGRA
jgi:RNA polymerase sigma factor (sigma-70 family)